MAKLNIKAGNYNYSPLSPETRMPDLYNPFSAEYLQVSHTQVGQGHYTLLWSGCRASTAYRERKYPHHDLLGAQKPGGNGIQTTSRLHCHENQPKLSRIAASLLAETLSLYRLKKISDSDKDLKNGSGMPAKLTLPPK
ncbi:hypothetical protein MPDQ_003693, partial [Monascus purpureus]